MQILHFSPWNGCKLWDLMLLLCASLCQFFLLLFLTCILSLIFLIFLVDHVPPHTGVGTFFLSSYAKRLLSLLSDIISNRNEHFYAYKNFLFSVWLFCAFVTQDSLLQRLSRAHHTEVRTRSRVYEIGFERKIGILRVFSLKNEIIRHWFRLSGEWWGTATQQCGVIIDLRTLTLGT